MADLFDFPSPPRSPSESGDREPESTHKKRNRTALFLSSDDEVLPSAKRIATRNTKELPADDDIDSFFREAEEDDLFGEASLAAPLDLVALRKQADLENARKSRLGVSTLNSRDLLPSSSPGGDTLHINDAGDDGGGKEKKPRKPVMKLDEARLLGPDGFPGLLDEARTFKSKGKGHEAEDLGRLLQVYQFWTHKLYPKTQFRDTVQRVEKLCHSRSMHSALSRWKDDFHGTIHGRKLPNSDSEDAIQETAPAEEPVPSGTGGGDELLTDEEFRPPSSRVSTMDDDEDMWGAFDKVIDAELESAQPTVSSILPARPPTTEDEEMWDVVRELESNEFLPARRPSLPINPAPTNVPQPPPDDEDDEFADLYA